MFINPKLKLTAEPVSTATAATTSIPPPAASTAVPLTRVQYNRVLEARADYNGLHSVELGHVCLARNNSLFILSPDGPPEVFPPEIIEILNRKGFLPWSRYYPRHNNSAYSNIKHITPGNYRLLQYIRWIPTPVLLARPFYAKNLFHFMQSLATYVSRLSDPVYAGRWSGHQLWLADYTPNSQDWSDGMLEVVHHWARRRLHTQGPESDPPEVSYMSQEDMHKLFTNSELNNVHVFGEEVLCFHSKCSDYPSELIICSFVYIWYRCDAAGSGECAHGVLPGPTAAGGVQGTRLEPCGARQTSGLRA